MISVTSMVMKIMSIDFMGISHKAFKDGTTVSVIIAVILQSLCSLIALNPDIIVPIPPMPL